jgi:Domain of unknown function (DUF4439)
MASNGTGPLDDSLQAALGGENAAMYAYSYLGGRATAGIETAMRNAFVVHRTQREALQAIIVSRGLKPAAALPAYAIPGGSAAQVALSVENHCCALYTNVIDATGTSDAAIRSVVIDALASCALWASHWSGTTTAFPGLVHEPS